MCCRESDPETVFVQMIKQNQKDTCTKWNVVKLLYLCAAASCMMCETAVYRVRYIIFRVFLQIQTETQNFGL